MADDGDYCCDSEAYEVGRGRPPKRHRIKPKEIRNPWGRKGKPRPEVDFLDAPFDLRFEGKTLTVTRREAIDYALFQAALEKNVSAAKELDNRWRQRALATKDNAAEDVVSLEEQEVLERYVQRRMKAMAAGTCKESERPKAPAQNVVPGGKK